MEKISTSEDIAIKNFQIETKKAVTKRKNWTEPDWLMGQLKSSDRYVI